MLGEIVYKRIVPVFYNCMSQVCPVDGFMFGLDDNMSLDDVLFMLHHVSSSRGFLRIGGILKEFHRIGGILGGIPPD